MTATLWNATQTQISATSYLRSWRQEIFSDYGTDFTLVCHMENVVCDSDGNKIGSTDAGKVVRVLSKVYDDPNVQAMMAAMTALVPQWYVEDHQPPVAP